MLSYPTTAPIDCFQYVLGAVKDRTVNENLPKFAQCLWNVQGFLQGLLIGSDPSLPGTVALDAVPNRDQQVMSECGFRLIQLEDELHEAATAAAMPTAVPWALILQYLPVIIQMLKELGILKTEDQGPVPAAE